MDDKELVADMRETVRYWEHIYPRDTWGSYQRAHEQAADRIEALTAKAEALAEALRGNGAWLESWGQHVGTCAGGNMCSCGLTFARYENSAALKAWEK